MHRRHFIRQSSLLAAATVLFSPKHLVLGGAPAISLDQTDQAVLQFIESYSMYTFMIGGSVAAKSSGGIPKVTLLFTQIADLARFSSALASVTSFGVDKTYANGNILTLVVNGRTYVLENLLAEEFGPRLGALQSGRSATFAHDALTFQPATGEVRDPLKAGHQAKFVRRSKTADAALADLIKGLIDAHQFGLAPDGAFKLRQTALLSGRAISADQATAIATVFLKGLPALSGALSPDELADFLKSRLLTSAFLQAFGVDTGAIIKDFRQLRAALGNSPSNAALWLAAALGSAIASGTGATWLDNSSAFQFQTQLTILAEATAIVQTPAFSALIS